MQTTIADERTAKGYSPGEVGNTGILPQLLNPIDEADVDALLSDDAWWMQEKFDGRRVLIRKSGAQVTGTDQGGLSVALPRLISEAVHAISVESCLLDGQAVGEVYHVFDLLEQDGTDLRDQPYALRYNGAMDLVDAVPSDHLRFAVTACTSRTKRAMLVRFRQDAKEGVVFKQRTAPYPTSCVTSHCKLEAGEG